MTTTLISTIRRQKFVAVEGENLRSDDSEASWHAAMYFEQDANSNN